LIITMDSAPAAGFIQCTLNGNPNVAGKTVRLDRNAVGLWNCTTTVAAARHKPEGCN